MSQRSLNRLIARLDGESPIDGTWHAHRSRDGRVRWVPPWVTSKRPGECALGLAVVALADVVEAPKNGGRRRECGDKHLSAFGNSPCFGPIEPTPWWVLAPGKTRFRKVWRPACQMHRIGNEMGLLTYRCTDACAERANERSAIVLIPEDLVTILPSGSVYAGYPWREGPYDGFFAPRCRFCGRRFRE